MVLIHLPLMYKNSNCKSKSPHGKDDRAFDLWLNFPCSLMVMRMATCNINQKLVFASLVQNTLFH